MRKRPKKSTKFLRPDSLLKNSDFISVRKTRCPEDFVFTIPCGRHFHLFFPSLVHQALFSEAKESREKSSCKKDSSFLFRNRAFSPLFSPLPSYFSDDRPRSISGRRRRKRSRVKTCVCARARVRACACARVGKRESEPWELSQ